MANARPNAEVYIKASQAIQDVPLSLRCKRYLESKNDDSEFLFLFDWHVYYTPGQWDSELPEIAKIINDIDEENLNTPEKCILLALGYGGGIGKKRDQQRAFKLYEQAAQQGSVLASVMIGVLHYQRKNYRAAKDCFEKQSNHPLAMRYLGILYDKKESGFQDAKQSKEWYEKASKSDVTALSLLGGILRDEPSSELRAQAFAKFDAAAQRGNLNAIARMGHLLMGDDAKSAWQCLDFAANADCRAGLYYSAVHLEQNDGGREGRLLETTTLYRRAYLQGESMALIKFNEFAAMVSHGRPNRSITDNEFIFNLALMCDLGETMSNLAIHESELFDRLYPSVRWDNIKYLLNPQAANAVLGRVIAVSLTEVLNSLVPVGGMGPVQLILQYCETSLHQLEQSVAADWLGDLLDDPVLVQFNAVNATPLVKIADEILAESTRLYLLMNESFFSQEKWKKEIPELGKKISALQEEKNKNAAQLILCGLQYEKGWGVDVNVAKAEECYRAVRLDQDPVGQTLLGLLCLRNFKERRAEAIGHLKQAATCDEPMAMYELSQLPEGKAEAGMHMHLAIEAEYPQALLKHAMTLLQSEPEQWGSLRYAKYSCRRAAELGLPQAMHLLGRLYCFGIFGMELPMQATDPWTLGNLFGYLKQLSPSHPRGIAYLSAAATCLPSGVVCFDLAKVYDPNFKVAGEKLELVEPDRLKAVRNYRKAMEGGDERAREGLEGFIKNILYEPVPAKTGLFNRKRAPAIVKALSEEDFEICFHAAVGLSSRKYLDELGKINNKYLMILLGRESPKAFAAINQLLGGVLAPMRMLSQKAGDHKDAAPTPAPAGGPKKTS